VRLLLETLAICPVLPPAAELPVSNEASHALLANLARGERSSHAPILREVAEEHGLAVDELARRAQFLLACLVLPSGGTYYNVLGVSSKASTQEIRKRWTLLIQRYHPDHMGSTSGWLEVHTRRLIEAYQTLRDPERRREYDTQLARRALAVASFGVGGQLVLAPRSNRPNRRQWAQLGILTIALALVVWGSTRRPGPLLALSTGPQDLESRGMFKGKNELGRADRTREDTRAPGAAREHARAHAVAEPPSAVLSERQLTIESASPTRGRSGGVSAHRGRSLADQPVYEPPARSVDPPVVGPQPGASTERHAEPSVMSSPVQVPPISSPVVEGSGITRVAPRISLPSPLPGPGESRALISAGATRVEPAPASHPSQPSQPSEIPPPSYLTPQEALEVIEAFREAYERKDVRTVMELFGSEPRDRNVSGRRAVEQLYVRNFAALNQINYKLDGLETKVAGQDGDMAIQGWFHIRAAGASKPSRSLDVAGPIRWLLRREGGTLRIVEVDYEVTAQ
jgi:curved DNA-binding protein CbpA